MGMIDRIRNRWYVWGWRLRYWYMDTQGGARAQVMGFVVACLMLVAQMIRMALAALMPSSAPAPAQAVYWWVVQLVILVVSAAVAYAMRPKPQQQAERQIDPPTVEDGTPVKDYGGTVWIEHDDNFLLGWKIVGRDAIKTKGGKK